MKIHDISVPIREEMPIYAGNPAVTLTRVQSLVDGASANVSKLELGVHTGTHVDAPLHHFDGEPGAESLPLEPLIGRAVVVDATAAREALDEPLVSALDITPGAERVLFKTRNSSLWERPDFTRDFVRLDGGGARYLVGLGVRLVGIDYLSVGDTEAHRVLLGAGVVALEGLDLRGIEPGEYRLICLPLRLEDADGAPARAVLLEEE
jgi:arylformamidase